MSRDPTFEIVQDTPELLLIRDTGDHRFNLTITNGVERVIYVLQDRLAGRRLEYIDSAGDRAEILIDGCGTFGGFRHVPQPNPALLVNLSFAPEADWIEALGNKYFKRGGISGRLYSQNTLLEIEDGKWYLVEHLSGGRMRLPRPKTRAQAIALFQGLGILPMPETVDPLSRVWDGIQTLSQMAKVPNNDEAAKDQIQQAIEILSWAVNDSKRGMGFGKFLSLMASHVDQAKAEIGPAPN